MIAFQPSIKTRQNPVLLCRNWVIMPCLPWSMEGEIHRQWMRLQGKMHTHTPTQHLLLLLQSVDPVSEGGEQHSLEVSWYLDPGVRPCTWIYWTTYDSPGPTAWTCLCLSGWHPVSHVCWPHFTAWHHQFKNVPFYSTFYSVELLPEPVYIVKEMNLQDGRGL